MGKEGGPNFILEERAYTTPKTTIEKIKQHFGHCFEITNFDEGDRFPVGGKSIFSTKADIEVIGDFENFKQFLTETHELAGKYVLPKLKEWPSCKSSTRCFRLKGYPDPVHFRNRTAAQLSFCQ